MGMTNGQTQQQQYSALAYAAAKQQAMQGIGVGLYQQAKEEPKNAFLESVKKVYMRRVEMWIRGVLLIGGVVLFAMSPVLGGMLYRFWRWLGVIMEIGFVGAAIISGFLMVMSIIAVIIALDGGGGSLVKSWARDWVEEK